MLKRTFAKAKFVQANFAEVIFDEDNVSDGLQTTVRLQFNLMFLFLGLLACLPGLVSLVVTIRQVLNAWIRLFNHSFAGSLRNLIKRLYGHIRYGIHYE